jgi:hypothetical protein
MKRSVRIIYLVALLVLPLVLKGASLPHTHFGAPDGFFNHEHDQTLLATIGTVASLDATAPAVMFVLVVMALAASAYRRPATTLVRTADSRAPPVR